MDRICGYARISVDLNEDKDVNTSIETQKKRITEYIRREYPDAAFDPAKDFFIDRDRSGYTFEQREGYQEMKKALNRGEYNIVAVKDLSRFTRRVSYGAMELENLMAMRVKVIFCDDNEKLDKQIDIMTYIRMIFAEDTVTSTSKKVSNAIATRQKEGTWICNAPYGYYIKPNDNGNIYIDEEGAEAVRKIFELYTSGYGYKAIAHYMTEHGYPTGRALMVKQMEAQGRDASKMLAHAPISKVWSNVSVAKIVTNDFYIGTLRQGVWKREGINKGDKRTDVKDHKIFENHHEPIIDLDTWAKAQRVYKKSTRHNYSGKSLNINPYVGIIRCGDCGSPMYAVGGKKYPRGYNCGNYLKNGIRDYNSPHRKRRKAEYSGLGCNASHYIAEATLNADVKELLAKVRDNLSETLAGLDVEKSQQAAQADQLTVKDLKEQAEELRAEIKINEQQRVRQIVRNEAREAEINEMFDEMNEVLYEQIRALELKITYLSEQSYKKKELKQSYEEVIAKFDNLQQKEQFTKTDLDTIIRQITVDSDKMITIELFSDIKELFELAQ